MGFLVNNVDRYGVISVVIHKTWSL